MLVQKSIQAKVLDLTNRKQRFLSKEYNNFQLFVNGLDWVNLYSATKQQAERTMRRNNIRNEQPMILRNDCFRVIEHNTKLTKWWVKIPVYDVRGGIHLPIKFSPRQEKLLFECKISDSKVVKKGKKFFIHISVKKEIKMKKHYNDVLAVDLGIRRIASVVQLSDKKPIFYGKEIREVRGHFFYLRKKLAKKKIKHFYKWINSNKEKQIINDYLHKLSREIVEQAKATNSVIVIGDLKDIRKNGKGRKFNRKLNSFPFYKLANYIRYKANWEGIEVIEVPEAYTSQLCWRCGEKGIRKNGLFKCPHCGLKDNADRNGALNIGKRAFGYISKVGVVLTQPKTHPASIKTPTENEMGTSLLLQNQRFCNYEKSLISQI